MEGDNGRRRGAKETETAEVSGEELPMRRMDVVWEPLGEIGLLRYSRSRSSEDDDESTGRRLKS
jgi:hypothetical protein